MFDLPAASPSVNPVRVLGWPQEISPAPVFAMRNQVFEGGPWPGWLLPNQTQSRKFHPEASVASAWTRRHRTVGGTRKANQAPQMVQMTRSCEQCRVAGRIPLKPTTGTGEAQLGWSPPGFNRTGSNAQNQAKPQLAPRKYLPMRLRLEGALE